MFPIDAAVLPSLATRKALLVVDAQNDFLAEDGALPVVMPINLAQRISDLAQEFRGNGGEIIWVQSQFESSRPVEEEQIMIANAPSPSADVAPARGRRPRTTPLAAEPVSSPEAFLTLDGQGGPSCVRAGAPGTEMHPVVKQAVGPRDHVLTKKFYSAFKADRLLELLRVKFVTELFICGSMTNVGVMATAIDAASYGYTITIVDDCCGSQSVSRYRTALRQIKNTTGCDTLSAAKVLSMMKPKPTSSERGDQQRQHRGAAGGRSPTVRLRRGKGDAVAPSVSDIQPSFERLSLSGEAAAADEHAPTRIAPSSSSSSPSFTPPSPAPASSQQRGQRQQHAKPKPKPKPQSPSALQPMARASHPQTQNQTDRDTVAAAASARTSSRTNAAASAAASAANNNSADVSAAAASEHRPSR